jgi:hypothetical protein
MKKLKRLSESNRSKFRHRISRRKFLGGIAAGATFTIVPRIVLGGKSHVPPSDKTTLVFIGMGDRAT